MIGTARYIAASSLYAGRWVAPALLFVVAVVVTFATGGQVLGTLGEGATWLLPISAWLTVATLNDEDPTQAAITAAAAGGLARARVVKLCVAAAVALGMAALSLLAGFLSNTASFTVGDLGAGAVVHVLTVAGGVALGSMCARPLITRGGRAALAIIFVTVWDLVIPHAPPARAVLEALSSQTVAAGHEWRSIGLAAGEVLVWTVVLFGLSGWLSRRLG